MTEDPKLFDSLTGKCWMAMKLLQNNLQNELQAHYPFLNTEQLQLMIELNYDDGVRPSVLAYRMQRTKSTISSLLKHAEKNELIALASDPKNKNAKKVHLTLKGKTILDDISPVVDALLISVTRNISEKDQKVVKQAMDSMLEELNPDWLHDSW
ncbi:MarR family winged helix-turn-helix transcriptional regulator [Photobacterium makurazakiensis]|uniref:MarR family winged helix-turn-helix transcriptional regulator n=1 Tax=Photobacterium TaxID=657 RepID=UPI003D152635